MDLPQPLVLPMRGQPAETNARNPNPITCYVLDSTTGRPAANMAVKLYCCTIPEISNIFFHCTTDLGGRISEWKSGQGGHGGEGSFVASHGGMSRIFDYMIGHYTKREGTANWPERTSVWRLEFNLGAYFGIDRTKLSGATVDILMKEGERLHVSVQAGPYGLTMSSV